MEYIYLFMLFVSGICNIISSSAQDFNPNVWSVDTGGNVDNVAGVTFFHANQPQEGSSGISIWDLGKDKQTETKENSFAIFSSKTNTEDKQGAVGTSKKNDQDTAFSGLPFDTSSSTTTELFSKRRLFKDKDSFMLGSQPEIPIVSMKKLNKSSIMQQGIYDFSQFGIKSDKIPAENKVESLFQNSDQTIPFGQKPNLEQTPTENKKGPTIRLVSAFEDHANKPVLRARGKFVDFTATAAPNITGDGRNKTKEQHLNVTPTTDTLVKSVGLPNVKDLAPVQVKPFEPLVSGIVSTTNRPVLSTISVNNVIVSTTLSSVSTGENDKTEGTSIINPLLINDANMKNDILSEMSSTANKTSNEENSNISGSLVVNQTNVDDITNDLWSRRITGKVPDGVPAGEKLKIDSLYPEVSESNPITGQSTNDRGNILSSSNNPTITNTKSGDTESVGGVLDTQKPVGQDIGNTLDSNRMLGNNSMLLNQNRNNNKLPTMSTANSNSVINGKKNVPIDVQSSSNNNEVIENSVFNANNNENGQTVLNNVASGQNWQRPFNSNLPNQPDPGVATSTRQTQIINGQTFNNGIPLQGVSLNTRVDFPVIGNRNNLNQMNNLQNGMFISQNRQMVSQGLLNNGVNNLNGVNNFQNRMGFQDGMRTVPSSTNIRPTGVNTNRINTNFQRGANQMLFRPSIDRRLGNDMRANDNIRLNLNVRDPFINQPTGFRNVPQNIGTGFQDMAGARVVNNGGVLRNSLEKQARVQINGNNIQKVDQSMVSSDSAQLLNGEPVSNNQVSINSDSNIIGGTTGIATGVAQRENENININSQDATNNRINDLQSNQVSLQNSNVPNSRLNIKDTQRVSGISRRPDNQQNVNSMNGRTTVQRPTSWQTNQANLIVAQNGQFRLPEVPQQNLPRIRVPQSATGSDGNSLPNQSSQSLVTNQVAFNNFQNMNSNFQRRSGQPVFRNVPNIQRSDRTLMGPNLPAQNFFPNALQNRVLPNPLQNPMVRPNFPAVPFNRNQQGIFTQPQINNFQSNFPANIPGPFTNGF